MSKENQIFIKKPVRKRGNRESRKLSFVFYQTLYGPFVASREDKMFGFELIFV
jgi:hypothetical protein